MTLQEKGLKILSILRKTYQKHTSDFVLWSSPLELVIGTVLSAQCTDKKVNQVTQNILFKKYKTAFDYANADLSTLEQEIFSLGFYHSKAKYLKGIGIIFTEKFGGEVPKNLTDLLTLPGVSFKTGHLIMSKAFGETTGIAVDTHVRRLAPRLGLTSEKNNTLKIAKDLETVFEPQNYLDINEYMILHGRAICKTIPQCERCPLLDICNYAQFRKKNNLL